MILSCCRNVQHDRIGICAATMAQHEPNLQNYQCVACAGCLYVYAGFLLIFLKVNKIVIMSLVLCRFPTKSLIVYWYKVDVYSFDVILENKCAVVGVQ